MSFYEKSWITTNVPQNNELQICSNTFLDVNATVFHNQRCGLGCGKGRSRGRKNFRHHNGHYNNLKKITPSEKKHEIEIHIIRSQNILKAYAIGVE